jgi:hypothetical protein
VKTKTRSFQVVYRRRKLINRPAQPTFRPAVLSAIQPKGAGA